MSSKPWAVPAFSEPGRVEGCCFFLGKLVAASSRSLADAFLCDRIGACDLKCAGIFTLDDPEACHSKSSFSRLRPSRVNRHCRPHRSTGTGCERIKVRSQRLL